MTRINSAIHPRYLTDEHLLAEHREIKRLPDFFKRAGAHSFRKIPKTFCLGTGHVTFFLNKQQFLYGRYNAIHRECINRGFNVSDYSENWESIGPEMQEANCWHDYTPTSEERKLLIARISERINGSAKPSFHYCGKAITKQEATQLLTDSKLYV